MFKLTRVLGGAARRLPRAGGARKAAGTQQHLQLLRERLQERWGWGVRVRDSPRLSLRGCLSPPYGPALLLGAFLAIHPHQQRAGLCCTIRWALVVSNSVSTCSRLAQWGARRSFPVSPLHCLLAAPILCLLLKSYLGCPANAWRHLYSFNRYKLSSVPSQQTQFFIPHSLVWEQSVPYSAGGTTRNLPLGLILSSSASFISKSPFSFSPSSRCWDIGMGEPAEQLGPSLKS